MLSGDTLNRKSHQRKWSPTFAKKRTTRKRRRLRAQPSYSVLDAIECPNRTAGIAITRSSDDEIVSTCAVAILLVINSQLSKRRVLRGRCLRCDQSQSFHRRPLPYPY